jgi:ABC-2 type transport system ATP-binding protein
MFSISSPPGSTSEHSNPLVIRDVTVRFGSTVALNNVDLDVCSGEIRGLIGPNGSGKTTLLRVASGLINPSAGETRSFENCPSSIEVRRRCFYVPFGASGFGELAVDEYLAYVAALRPRAVTGSNERSELLTRFGLSQQQHRRLGALSTGQQRLVRYVSAIEAKPDLLLIDEASATLDPEAVIELRRVLRQLADAGTAVLLATQDLAFAERSCDTVTLLSRGEVIESGSVTTLLARVGADDLDALFEQLVVTRADVTL